MLTAVIFLPVTRMEEQEMQPLTEGQSVGLENVVLSGARGRRSRLSERISIRRSAPGDGSALYALAALDERDWAGGPALVAEVDGTLEAALPLDGSSAFADPFAATAEIVALLELRAAQLGLARRGS